MDRLAEVETDVLVVGAGPIGIEVACALRERGVRFVHVEAGAIGETMRWWAPGTKFFSSPERIGVAGVPLTVEGEEKATGEGYVRYLRQVVGAKGLEVRTHERVVGVDRGGGGGFGVRTRTRSGRERVVRCGRVVLAVGNMDRANRIGVEGEDLAHVSHVLGDPHGYFGRDVLIVGGRNSAVEAAIRLYRVGARVSVSYRRASFSKKVKYWLRPELLWLIETGRIGFYPESVVDRIGAGVVELVRSPMSEGAGDGWRAALGVDDVLLLTGYVQDPGLFRMFGVGLAGELCRPVHDEDTMETDVGGVYVAGTAAAGTQLSGVTHFIETSHVHAERIAAALSGGRLEVETPRFALEES